MNMSTDHLSYCRELRCDDRCAGIAKPHHASKEKGQALLELALFLPVVLVLTIGILEIGRLAYYGIEVSNAARAGAQYATQSLALAATATTDTTNITNAAQLDAPDVTPGLAVTAVQSCGCPGAAAGGCPALGCTYPLVYLTVTTTYTLNPLFHYPGFPASFPLTGSSTMPVRQ
jgi:Flp pilus assembly protein TadG